MVTSADIKKFRYTMNQVLAILIFAAISFCFNSWSDGAFVKSCPQGELEWNNRIAKFDCNPLRGLYYHCLKALDGGFFESCHTKTGIETKDGCAVFDVDKVDNVTLVITFVDCNASYGCPNQTNNGAAPYPSNEIYKYPSCIDQFNTNEVLNTGYIVAAFTMSDFMHSSTVMNIYTTQVLSSWKSALIFIGAAVFFAIIFGLICLVLLQCQRIKRYKYEMEKSTYMSSVPYNTHFTHIYHQDTDIYDYVDDTDMIDDDKNTPESNELRQKSDGDDESSSEAYVEPNRPDIESMGRNEIFDLNTQMKNAPLSCNMVRQDTYLEPKVGLLTDMVRRDNVDVIESDGSMPSQNQHVCVKLTRLVSNDSYVEPSIGFHRSSQEDVECNLKEESSSVISNKNITEDEIAQNSESEELNLQDLNSDVHYDDASSRINTSFKEPSNPSETVSDLNISDKAENRLTESILNNPVRRNENIVISKEPVETRSSQLEPIRNDDYIDPI